MARDIVVRGNFVRGEVSSSDASGGVAATLYNQAGQVFTLGSTQRLVLYDVVVIVEATGNITLTDGGADTAGHRIMRGTVGNNGGIVKGFVRPVELPKNSIPKLFAVAGQADLSFTAEVLDT